MVYEVDIQIILSSYQLVVKVLSVAHVKYRNVVVVVVYMYIKYNSLIWLIIRNWLSKVKIFCESANEIPF